MSDTPSLTRRSTRATVSLRALLALLVIGCGATVCADEAPPVIRLLPPAMDAKELPQPLRLPPLTVGAEIPVPLVEPIPTPVAGRVAPAGSELIPAPPEDPPAAMTEPLQPIPQASFEIGFCEYCGDTCQSGRCCTACQSSGRWGRFGRAIYRGLCCPDPCYSPKWRPLADAAFFTSAVRPQNQQRFRWDFAEDLTLPDRAEYFWQTRSTAPQGVDYDELKHYVEVAHKSFGAWVEYSYRAVDVDGAHAAGFGDITIGTKTLLFDTELVQLAFQFATHVPAGVGAEGLGTGHTSLEPGLVFGVNLSRDSFLQAELTQWIPLGGDADVAGALFRYNASYNHVLWRPHPCVPLIGMVELNGWRFQDGGYNDPNLSPTLQSASGESYVHGATGLRLFFCDRADFGVGCARAITSNSWAETVIRTEFRVRY